MNKEEVLQKVNDYCNEKSYTTETLTDDFKGKFSDFFARKYPDTDVNDAAAIADLQFNLNTAFSASSKVAAAKISAFAAKENDYKRQIEELNNRLSTQTSQQQTPPALPKELQDKLDRLEKFETDARKNEKFKEVLALAKSGVRTDLHRSLENYAADFSVTLDATSEEQAKKLTSRFQEIFKDSIGDIKPFAPKQTQKRDEEFLASLPKVKI